MWIARSSYGNLFLYLHKPDRYESDWSDDGFSMLLDTDEHLSKIYEHIKWEDEPEEVYISLKNHKRNKRCTSCGEEFSYRTSDINYTTVEEPWSAGYFEDYNYVICPHCGKSNQV